MKWAAGGMGVVYLVHDPFIDRHVAIKVGQTPPSDNTKKYLEYQERFFNEARAAGKLTHRNIVSVYDAFIDDYNSFLVMEYVDGPTLAPYTRKDQLLPIGKVVNIIFQAAKALDFAHDNGVIHRDIKPSNIMVSEKGMTKISDFGIASIADDPTPEQIAEQAGSLHYSSPEQLRNEVLTPQSDIYSLGVVLFELLTGEKPFQADTDVGLFYQITQGEPERLRSCRSDVPESLELIVAHCLARDLHQRYITGLHLAQELVSAFEHLRNLQDEMNHEEKINSLKKIGFFSAFSASELTEVVKATSWVRHEAAATIISEGEIDDSFYILVSGEVLVRKRGQSLATLNPGDCFGEMAYLGKTKRTASIIAACDAVLMKVNTSLIDRMSMSTQLRFYRVFSTTLIERLARTSDKLSKVGP